MIPGFQETLDEMLRVAKAKNHDYSQGAEEPFKNFELVERMGVATAAQGLYTRISDKYSRVATLMKRPGMVYDEKIGDTLLDLANYAIIMKCYMESKDD